MPAIYQFSESAEPGEFAGYGPRLGHIYWQAASLVARVFRGERPQDMPVEQDRQNEFVINLKTAKAIGSTIAETFLIRADNVIE